MKWVIRKYSLLNAVAHDGKAEVGAVVGKVLGERAELRGRARELTGLVSEIVQETNRLTFDEQKSLLKEYYQQKPESTKTEKPKVLPPLLNADRYREIVTRFSPNPDCALHLGSARAIILSHDYARMYSGKFLLRFEDTDPRLKRSALEFYEMIREDLSWLGCKWDAEFTQSDRMTIYYEYAKNLIEVGGAYVCVCDPEVFKTDLLAMKPCGCRDLPVDEHLDRWNMMLDGTYAEGEAVVRVKTELSHPNPAVRDWPALRIIDTEKNPHPRVGSKYRVWPLYNFSTGIDDHLMGITHIIRGKEHLTNMTRQLYMYKHLSWEYPETIHYGRLKIEGATLSKSRILRMLSEGEVRSLDDPRLATLAALRRRGITPEALRSLVIEVGPRPVDATLAWENIYAVNRKIIDPIANRYFFVHEPVELLVEGVREPHISKPLLNPNDRSRGCRRLGVKPERDTATLLITRRDLEIVKKGPVRLMELFNIRYKSSDGDKVLGTFQSTDYSEARRLGVPLIHWLPSEGNIQVEVMMPDGKTISGLAEPMLADEKPDRVVQLVRFGFGRIEKTSKDHVEICYAHS
ncbi:glutamate--tRNA ligase [Candidatus Bathyarchaeota archaeon]|nr:glutamate--tRNA ligase [Candidatus Bathyarchaeota archaeon]